MEDPMRSLILMMGVALALPTHADAAPCDTLPNPVYLQVGDTQLNLMKRLGRAFRDNAAKPITMVFVTSGSCANIQAIYTRIPITTNLQYIPSLAEDPAWTPASATLTCTPPVGGVVPDIANSALFNSACTTAAPPATVNLIQGPAQAYVMAVPESQTQQTAITFEEAYFVFGFGTAGGISPWTDEAQMFIRSVTKSTLLAWAANISVPADKWKGTRFDGSPMVVSALETATTPNAIGILGAEVYDGKRATLNSLAFRAKGQYAAYYPDSTATSLDKKNVRDGHYTVWSPTIWMDTISGTTPVKPDARYIIDVIAGHPVAPPLGFDSLAIVAAVGLVPDCAMGVTRAFEGGPLSLYTPTTSCTCKYESLVATSSCAACSATVACATGSCRNNFCESH
jgi:hypothetical protein